jgi:hypothetical protein
MKEEVLPWVAFGFFYLLLLLSLITGKFFARFGLRFDGSGVGAKIICRKESPIYFWVVWTGTLIGIVFLNILFVGGPFRNLIN